MLRFDRTGLMMYERVVKIDVFLSCRDFRWLFCFQMGLTMEGLQAGWIFCKTMP